MKHIRKFESFDSALPVASRSALTNYYSCDECDGLWREFNKEYSECKFCGSDEIEELSSEEYHDLAKERLKPDEIDGYDKEESEKDLQLIGFDQIDKFKKLKNAN